VLSSPRRFRASWLVDDGEFKAVAEVDEALAMPVQMQIDAALLVVVVGLRGSVGIGESDPPGVILDDVGIITGIATLAAVRCRPVRFFVLRRVLSGQPTVAV